MPQTGSDQEAKLDLLLGKAALERNLITPSQLRDALAEQALGVARGRKLPRPLGVIFASHKWLTDLQVAALSRELEERLQRLSDSTQREAFFGRILADADLAAPRHVEECLLAQAEMIESGQEVIPRLGELLVQRGYATPEDIRQAVALQQALIRTCPKCGISSSLPPDVDPDRCVGCGAALEASLPPSALSLSGTMELPPPAPVTEGPRRLGKFEFQGVLGRGGCGIVYKALDTDLNRTVALKFMHREPGANEGSSEVERFIREARLAARLSHPNIVRVFEAGIIDDQHFIAMECIEGASMSKWRRSGSITIRQQVRVLRDAALAVHAAHQQGITHRDLKPDNVLVDLRGKAYVMDFGLAKKADADLGASITLEGHLMGTPAYMSPEQARGKKSVSRLSDVWSLGIMLFEILAGRTPFKGDSPIATLMHVMRDPLPSLASLAPALMTSNLYRPLEQVTLRALQKEPGERYPSAKEFADDLSKWLKGDEVRVVPRRRSRLSPKTAWIGAGAAALLSILLIATMPSSTPSFSKPLQEAREALARGDAAAARDLYLSIREQAPGHLEAEAGLKRANKYLDDELQRLKRNEGASAPPADPSPAAPPDGDEWPRRWLLAGPFPNTGLDGAHAPERGIDVRDRIRGGLRGDVSWQMAVGQITATRGAVLRLLDRFQPNTQMTAYGLIHVWSPSQTEVRLHVGSDDGGKIWINGSEVYRKDVNRAVKPDEDVVPSVRLRFGWNRILFKVAQGNGDMGLAFRIEGASRLVYAPYGDLLR